MFISIKRVLKFGFQSLWRNKGLSFQVVFTMMVAIFVFTSLFIFKELGVFMIQKAQEKVDISVYFKKDTGEDEILNIKKELARFSNEIEKVTYISQEKAQEVFLEKHKNDPLYLSALEEVGGNPFLPSLNIKAKDPVFYAQISEFLNQAPFKDLIEHVSYYQSSQLIDKLLSLIRGVKKAGLVAALVSILLVLLLTFNTIKLSIFAFRDEISTMRLVGASNRFIRGPFLVQGFLYGIISLVFVDVLIIIGAYFFNEGVKSWLFNFDLFQHIKANFTQILLWQFVFASLLGTISSFFAVRKYLKI
jgi:cell division transport system permease protein